MKENDSVGKAIEQIKLNLNHLSSQHEKSIWLQNGKSQLSELLRGDKHLDEFAKQLFDFSFHFLECQIGTFYHQENDNLHLVSTFGNSFNAKEILSINDSFYQSIFKQHSPHVLENLDADFFKISTSFGTFKSVSVIIIPLIFDGKLVGMLEFGKMNSISPEEINFWSETSEAIAIYLNTLLGKKALVTLLSDLDAKEQELQNQIKAINKAALVVEFDMQGNISNANNLFCNIMGYQVEELIGKQHRIFVDSDIDYDKEYAPFWKNLSEGQVITGEFQRKSKEGKLVWLQASYNPVTDNNGKVYKVLKIGYDITLMKEQRIQLEVMALKMNQQVEALNKAAIVSETDKDGNIIFVNEYFCKISEYSKEELIGQNHRILKSGKQPEGIFKGMWKAITSGLLWQGEILNKSKNGNYYWVETTIMPFKDKDGNIEKFVAIRFDITKQKESEALKRQTELLMSSQRDLEAANTELEAQTQKLQASEEELRVQQEELSQSNKELEEKTKMLEERNAAFNEKNNLLIAASAELRQKAEQLELSSKYKSEFLANMSHELRTPLNSILLLSKLMSDNLEGNLSSDQIEYSSVIHKAGSSLLELINDILDLSKIESGKMDVNAEMLSIAEFEKEIKSLFSPISMDKSIDFGINIDANCPPTIFTDKLRLGQVVKNLLSNAFKFSPNGKVSLNVHFNESTKFISFSVVDNGIGIPKDKQALVFEAFQQADGSTRRKYGGTGLGLSISREISRLLGGEISLESEPGKGSNFTMSIPATYSSESITSDTKQEESSLLSKIAEAESISTDEIPKIVVDDDRLQLAEGDKSILIVEDDVYFLKILQDAAKTKGYKVLVATNGRDAIELVNQYKPLGIVLDLHLPIKNGWEVMKQIKSQAETRHIPVHIISSQDIEPKVVLENGAFDFTSKPISESGLKNLFDSISEVALKQNGKIILFYDKDEQKEAISSFLLEKNIESVSFKSDSINNWPADFSNFDAIIVDIDSRKSAIPNLLEQLRGKIKANTMPVIVLNNTYLSTLDQRKIKNYQNHFILKIATSYLGVLEEMSMFLNFISRDLSLKKMRPPIVSAKVLENKTILLVDDDNENRFSISKIIELQNAKVIHAVNGRDALDKFSTTPVVDAVLMDIMMPEMDGYEAMRELRKMDRGKTIPIIALTAKTQPDERENCLKNGASDYMPKPIDAELMISLLKVWINQNLK